MVLAAKCAVIWGLASKIVPAAMLVLAAKTVQAMDCRAKDALAAFRADPTG